VDAAPAARSADALTGAVNDPSAHTMSSDLLRRTADLMRIPSESFEEAAITDVIETELRGLDHLQVTRVGDNVVARTTADRPMRVVLAGHTDTVPANGNVEPRIDGDVLWGVGASDMKSGLAVMLELAANHRAPAVDVTYVFYAREEVAAVHSGLGELFDERPDLLTGDVAILGEPTDGQIEAGCQGTLRFRIVLHGARAHTARAWMGRNAIHRVGALLRVLEQYEARRPEVLGCHYHEALQAVRVEGGVAGNVVPDRVEVEVGHRFAPDRTVEAAAQHVRSLLAAVLEPEDEIELVDSSPAAAPAVGHPCVAALIDRHGLAVTAKLGWTDVARFAERGIPAVNLGPGDATLAHTAEERVERVSIERAHAALDDLLRRGP
jgi:succinyl-diaminopimelate desuccinylase